MSAVQIGALDRLFEKKICICEGCDQRYKSNINHRHCRICENICQEIYIKTVMKNTWTKLFMIVRYKVKTLCHDLNCKYYDSDERITKFYTNLRLPLLKKFKSQFIGSDGEITCYLLGEYLQRYCKDDDVLCNCGKRTVYSIVKMYVEMDDFCILK